MKCWALALCIALALGGCSQNFSLNFDAVTVDKDIEDNRAVILVGNGGTAAIDYLQFTQAAPMPPINVRGKNVQPNGILAVPIPVGTKSLSLAAYARTDRPTGVMPTGSYYGHIPVNTAAIDIDTKGIYYIVTLFPGRTDAPSPAPDPAALQQFRQAHPRLAQLPALNFAWPY